MAHLIDQMLSFQNVSFLTKARETIRAHAQHRKERRACKRMLKMSNRELADIGLTRADIRDAMTNTFSSPGSD